MFDGARSAHPDVASDGPFPDLDQILQAANNADDGPPPPWLFDSHQSIKSFLEAQRDACGHAMVGDFRLVPRGVNPPARAQRAALSRLAEILEECLDAADRVEQGGPNGLVVLFAAGSAARASETTTQILRRTGRELRDSRETAAFAARAFCFDYAPYLDGDGTCDVAALRARAEQEVAARIADRHRATGPGADTDPDARSLVLQFAPIVVPRKRMMVGYLTKPVERVSVGPDRAAASGREAECGLALDCLSALSEVLARRPDRPNVLLTLTVPPALLDRDRDRDAFEAALFALPDHARRRLFLNVDLSRAVAPATELPYIADSLAGRGRGLFFSVPLDFTDFHVASTVGCQALAPVLPQRYSDSAKDRHALRRFTETCRAHGLKSAWFPKGTGQLSGRAILSACFDMFSFPPLLPPVREPDPVYRLPRRRRGVRRTDSQAPSAQGTKR